MGRLLRCAPEHLRPLSERERRELSGPGDSPSFTDVVNRFQLDRGTHIDLRGQPGPPDDVRVNPGGRLFLRGQQSSTADASDGAPAAPFGGAPATSSDMAPPPVAPMTPVVSAEAPVPDVESLPGDQKDTKEPDSTAVAPAADDLVEAKGPAVVLGPGGSSEPAAAPPVEARGRRSRNPVTRAPPRDSGDVPVRASRIYG